MTDKLKLTIGDVVFAKDGIYSSIMGGERVELLRRVYRGESLPAGWTVIALNPQREITGDAVNWETAGLAVTGGGER